MSKLLLSWPRVFLKHSQRMEERKKYLHSAWITASYFYPKREEKEQNPLASSNICQPELQYELKISQALLSQYESIFF